MNAFDDIRRHWKWCPLLLVKHTSGGEAVEPMATLCISGRFRGNIASGAGLHSVVMFLMDLHILAKFRTDVFVKVNCRAGGEFTWVDCPGDSILGRQNIQPKITGTDHLYNLYAWQFLKWQCIKYGATWFLQGLNPSFSHWYMFLTRTLVESYAQCSQFSLNGLKLSISFNDFQLKTSFYIGIFDYLDVLQNSSSLCVL
jgi:hypothetical protein